MIGDCQVVERVSESLPWWRACGSPASATIVVRDKATGDTLEMRVCAGHAEQARSGLFPRAADYREERGDGWSPAKLADVFFNGRKA